MQNRVLPLEEIHFPKKEIGQKYKTIKMIGKGSYGYVVRAQNVYTNQIVAIKKITDMFSDPIDTRRILRELMILRKMNNPNIIKFIEVITPLDPHNFTSLYIVTECCQADLNCMFKSEKIFLEIDHVQFITYQILCGLKYLHSLNIIHRDLKPANVLINQGSIIKICDFGLSRSLEGLAFNKKQDIQSNKNQQQQKYINQQLLKELEHQYERSSHIKSEVESESPTKVAPKLSKKISRQTTQRKAITKQLTRHVTTRWYRAPEVILLQRKYDSAIDMWSVGCIFGELLHMVRAVCAEGERRAPLFPGQKCFPLSPGKKLAQSPASPGEKQKKINIKQNKELKMQNDQLDYIFSFLGAPTEEDINLLTDQKAKQYLRTFKSHKKSDFRQRFPGASSQALDFLKKVLVFNPKKRLTVDQALEHPFFKDVKDPKSEIIGQPLVMEFQQETHISIQKLRELFIAQFKLQ